MLFLTFIHPCQPISTQQISWWQKWNYPQMWFTAKTPVTKCHEHSLKWHGRTGQNIILGFLPPCQSFQNITRVNKKDELWTAVRNCNLLWSICNKVSEHIDGYSCLSISISFTLKYHWKHRDRLKDYSLNHGERAVDIRLKVNWWWQKLRVEISQLLALSINNKAWYPMLTHHDDSE